MLKFRSLRSLCALTNHLLQKCIPGGIALTGINYSLEICCGAFSHLLYSKMPRISVEKRSLVIEFSNEGMSQNEIAKSLSICRRSVQYIIKRFKETGKVADRERSGRPRILSKRLERGSFGSPRQMQCGPRDGYGRSRTSQKLCPSTL